MEIMKLCIDKVLHKTISETLGDDIPFEIRERMKWYLVQYEGTLANLTLSCKKANIDRSTIKRWRTLYISFDEALKTVELSLIDAVESQLLKLALQGNLGAMKMFLMAHSDKYNRALRDNVVEIYTEQNAEEIDRMLGNFKEEVMALDYEVVDTDKEIINTEQED